MKGNGVRDSRRQVDRNRVADPDPGIGERRGKGARLGAQLEIVQPLVGIDQRDHVGVGAGAVVEPICGCVLHRCVC